MSMAPRTKPGEYLSDAHGSILLEAHEERLRTLERSFQDLTSKMLPAMARLETVVTAGFDRVNESMERGEQRFDEIEVTLTSIKKAASEDTARDLHRDVGLSGLQKIEEARAEHRKLVKKWVFGIASALIVAILLAVLGFKK